MSKTKLETIKGKVPVLVAILIIVLAFIWLAGRCSHNLTSTITNDYSRPGGDTLAVAIEMSPMSYQMSGDTVSGFDYEMLRDIAAQHSLNIKFQPFAPLDYAYDGLRRGDFDIVVASVPSSADAGDDLAFTDDIYIDRQVLVCRKDSAKNDSAIPAQLCLLGDTVWVTESSPFKKRLVNISHELGDTIFIRSNPDYSSEHLVILVGLGEIKQAVVNESVARRIAADYPDIDISTPVSLNQFQPWIVPKNRPELLDSLNGWIRQYKETQRYRDLEAKYLNR